MIKGIWICALCEEVFQQERPEQESIEEKERNFPGVPDEQMGKLCTDCFVQVMLFAEKELGHPPNWRRDYEDLIAEIQSLK